MNDMKWKTRDLCAAVHDRASFLVFLHQLVDDWDDASRQERELSSLPHDYRINGWENHGIDSFLDAALAWAETCANRADKDLPEPVLPEEPSWRSFARILIMGKEYE